MDIERKSSIGQDKISQGGRKHIRQELARVRKPDVSSQERKSAVQQIAQRRISAPSAAELKRQKEEERISRAQTLVRRDEDEVQRLTDLLNQKDIDKVTSIETQLKLLWFNVKFAPNADGRRETVRAVNDFYQELENQGKEDPNKQDLLSHLESRSSDPNNPEDYRPLGVKIKESIIPSELWRVIQKDIFFS